MNLSGSYSLNELIYESLIDESCAIRATTYILHKPLVEKDHDT